MLISLLGTKVSGNEDSWEWKFHLGTKVPLFLQGYDLGLDVLVSRPSRDILTSHLDLVSCKIANVSVSEQFIWDLFSVLAQKVSASHLGSRTILSR